MDKSAARDTASDALMSGLYEAGVSFIFGNLGSDHADIIESMAKAADNGTPLPKVVLCPHEGVAIAAAHGYAQVSGCAQAVFVHVDVGTQNLGGGISNALHALVHVRWPHALHHRRRTAGQPEPFGHVFAGCVGPGRHRAPVRQMRLQHPHQQERQAAGAPRDPDRRKRSEGAGLPDRRARSAVRRRQ